jgi:hypothetical protein
MFSRISQFGKNITDEFENVVNSGRGDSGPGSNRQGVRSPSNAPANVNSTQGQIKVLNKNAHLLGSQTPDPSSLEVQEPTQQNNGPDKTEDDGDTSKKETEGDDSRPSSGLSQPNSEQSTTADNGPAENTNKIGGDGMELPREIVQKLKKFNKYEEKYPGVLDLFMFACNSD